jgi:ankyrin repeat protein
MIETANDELVDLLLDYGADPNIPSIGEQVTPLITAIENEKIHMFLAFLKHGADPDIKTSEGQTALDAAKEKNSVVCIQVLERLKAAKSLFLLRKQEEGYNTPFGQLFGLGQTDKDDVFFSYFGK